VMSASNLVFFNCKFEATRGLEFYKAEFGSAARPDAFINCTFPISTPQARVAWVRGVAVPRINQYTLTYKNKDTSGNPVVIYDDTASVPALTYSRELSEQELAAYNPWNLLRAAPGSAPDDWDPAGVKGQYEKSDKGNGVYRMTLRIGDRAEGGNRGGVGGFGGGAPAVAATIRTGGAGVSIGAAFQPIDAADKTITWSTKSDLVTLSQTTGPDIEVTGKNTTEQAQYVAINASAPNGFYVTAYVYVEPKFIDPPKVTSAPKIDPPSDGKAGVDYALDLGGRLDQSLITWFTCDDASGTNPKKVAVSRGNEPLKAYILMPGDVGKFLRVSVEPKLANSEAGPAVYGMSVAPIAASDVISSTASANFRNFVEAPTSATVAGLWTIQGMWTVLAGNNYVDGFGVRAGSGARGNRGEGCFLYYFKDGDTGDMQVDLVITPDKTEGTVFAIPGSPNDSGPTNSHGDIFMKFDPRTRTGYSLRYWRTTKSAAACTYQFYKIENGIGSPLNDAQVQSGVFKQNTLITLKVTGSTISVDAHNTVDDQTLKMEAPITPNKFSGAGVFASGAVNVYSQIKVSYP
jgi:hypothetical protein